VPFATGNLHPRFMGWVHGAGTPIGMVAEMIAAGLNMNCGGRDHVGIEVERQIVRWMRDALGYPDEATGLFLTGSSMANFLAIIVAKTSAIGDDMRQLGLQRAGRELVAYTSTEAHGCISRAMELSGIGSANLRRIEVDAAGRMRTDALREAIAKDRDAGLSPFLIVATAGTVNTGAIDPLKEIFEIACHERLWFHVDGAIGALRHSRLRCAICARESKRRIPSLSISTSGVMFLTTRVFCSFAMALHISVHFQNRPPICSEPTEGLRRAKPGRATSGRIFHVDFGRSKHG
jgi:aromatic-L-amino-acid/L-tryptophan decarboxylase